MENSVSTVLGFLGDFTTFVGGVVLAYEAITREREFHGKRKLTKTLGALTRVTITHNGVLLTDDKDVELAFIRQTAKRAVIGTIVLTLGFIFLLIARLYGTLA